MNTYDDKLETLLLEKDYAALTATERSYVARSLGDEAAYAAERVLRLRSRQILAVEPVPADPDGLAAVMARTRRPALVVPLWQAAAAVLLIAVLAWWGRGLSLAPTTTNPELLASIDTVLKEIRVVDTVYLPAPQVADHPLRQPDEAPRIVRKAPLRQPDQAPPAVRKVPRPRKVSPKLAAAIATMPEPAKATRVGGGTPATTLPPDGQMPYPDKFQIGN